MKVLPNRRREYVNKVVECYVDKASTIISDKSTSYVVVKKFVEKHISLK